MNNRNALVGFRGSIKIPACGDANYERNKMGFSLIKSLT